MVLCARVGLITNWSSFYHDLHLPNENVVNSDDNAPPDDAAATAATTNTTTETATGNNECKILQHFPVFKLGNYSFDLGIIYMAAPNTPTLLLVYGNRSMVKPIELSGVLDDSLENGVKV